MSKSLVVIVCLLLVLVDWSAPAAPGLASDAASLLDQANQCRKSLYKSSSRMKYRHNWMKCIEQYQRIHQNRPESDEAAWALYFAGRMYTKLYRFSGREADLENAIAFFKQLAEDYSQHRLADDAQFRIGEIYCEEMDNPTQAYVEFLKVDIKFPAGDMRPKAREMMDELAAVLSKKEEEKRKDKPDEAGREKGGLVKVEKIRHWSTPSYTRVVIDMEDPVKFESHLLKQDPKLNKPERLYIDLRKSYAPDIESSIPIQDGLLRRARAAQHTAEVVRVVLDIESIQGYKIFPLHDPFRIVVDVQGTKDKEEKAKIEELKKKARKGIRRVPEPSKDVSLARQLGLTVERVVIDPGHGGKDPGCIFSGGIREKEIVLDMSKILARKIESELGCEAILTRVDDVFIPLERRTAFANLKKGDLFISLHVNAHHQAGIQGIETYFLNMATDERAVLVAARENSTSEKNISDLQTILNDLMLNTKINESSKLAHEIQQGMIKRVREKHSNAKSLGVKQAPFYVLIGAEMPAVLVEAGFITNPEDRRRLLDKAYLESVADGITEGVASYIKEMDLILAGGG
ncbi:MAG: N-acetylmuramoyl-L-alanine amidase [Desulfobacteraceae bacterium]